MAVAKIGRRAFLASAPDTAVMTLGAVILVAIASALPSLAQSPAAAIARGKASAEKHCAICHATGRTGASKLAKAPPLRIVARRYKLENLEEAFAEGIVVSHRSPEMPPFELDPDTIQDLLAYMKTLKSQ